QVEPELDRPLNPGTREGVVRNGNNIFLARGFCDRFEIDQFEQWIARRLNPDHARVWLDRVLESVCVRQIDKGEIEISGTATHLFEKAERSAVKIVAHDNVRTAVDCVEGGGHRGEAGCTRETAGS